LRKWGADHERKGTLNGAQRGGKRSLVTGNALPRRGKGNGGRDFFCELGKKNVGNLKKKRSALSRCFRVGKTLTRDDRLRRAKRWGGGPALGRGPFTLMGKGGLLARKGENMGWTPPSTERIVWKKRGGKKFPFFQGRTCSRIKGKKEKL